MSGFADHPPLLAGILDGLAELQVERGERGLVDGRRTSTIASRRAPADMDVLVLRDPRTGVLALLLHWAGRVRWEQGIPAGKRRTVGSEARVLADHWEWAATQPWGAQMVAQLESLADLVHEARYGAPVRPCPVCGEPVRLDRFVREHRACLDIQP